MTQFLQYLTKLEQQSKKKKNSSIIPLPTDKHLPKREQFMASVSIDKKIYFFFVRLSSNKRGNLRIT
jgi:hypothetical protein